MGDLKDRKPTHTLKGTLFLSIFNSFQNNDGLLSFLEIEQRKLFKSFWECEKMEERERERERILKQ